MFPASYVRYAIEHVSEGANERSRSGVSTFLLPSAQVFSMLGATIVALTHFLQVPESKFCFDRKQVSMAQVL